MRLHGSTTALLVMLALSACGNDATRPGLRVTRSYVLESIDGQTLPTNFEAASPSLTALSGTLSLDSTGSSTATTHVHQTPSNFDPSDFDTVLRGEYRFRGDSIEIGFFGTCRDLCVPNRLGVVSDSTLVLEYLIFMGSGPHSFLYRLVSSQP